MQPLPPAAPDETEVPDVPFRTALRTWARVGALGFGGPAGQIAVMHRILVEEKRWIGEAHFLHALNYCMLLPGPEAQQLATYIGWLMHRVRGGLAAGLLFILPGIVSILGLSILYASYRDTTLVSALFFGLKPAVIAVVVEAVVRIGRRALANRARVMIAAAAFVCIFFLHLPYPLILAGAGIAGYVGGRVRPDLFAPAAVPAAGAGRRERRVEWRGTVRTVAVCAVLWWAPVAALALWVDPGSVFLAEGLFFGHAAAVTFGGAYAVLAYVAQQAVETYGWLAPGEMLDGLGMAETTPGPLIMVLQFVGFMGAYRNPGGLPPLTAGVLGSLLTTWVTFAPSFLFIFAGAPYIERLRGHRGLGSTLSGITAAVVGVVLNLAVWFAVHVLFARVGEARLGPVRVPAPEWASLDPASLVIAVAAALALFRYKRGMIPVLGGAAAAGILYRLLTGG